MKKTLAGLGVLALVALGATGVSFPATAATVQPVAEIVAESDAIIASPDAVLVHSKPVVATTAAPKAVKAPEAPKVVPKVVKAPKPVAVAPKAPKARVTAPKPVQPVAVAPVAPVAPAVDPYSGNPIVDCEAQGLITAEDYSCVAPTFYEPVTGTDAKFFFLPCDHEDDTVTSSGQPVDSCYWDATARGNGLGDSFTKFANGDIVYDRK